jgi:mRNA interferase YafQ
MKVIRKTTQFKKDFKKIRHVIEKVKALLEIVKLLELEKEIPLENKPHRLIGDFNQYMPCRG